MIRAYVLVTATAGKAQHVADALRGSDGVVLVDALRTGLGNGGGAGDQRRHVAHTRLDLYVAGHAEQPQATSVSNTRR